MIITEVRSVNMFHTNLSLSLVKQVACLKSIHLFQKHLINTLKTQMLSQGTIAAIIHIYTFQKYLK